MADSGVRLPRAIQFAQSLITERVSPGDLAIDATVGNGHDTLFLAGLVGETGKVIGCDLQDSAIASATEKVGAMKWVELHVTGHENLSEILPAEMPVSAAMFNLGYLPGADKSLITRPETTISALETLLPPLTRGGIITVVLYTGHSGGLEEAQGVAEWAAALNQKEFSAITYQFLNQKNTPPALLAIEKK